MSHLSEKLLTIMLILLLGLFPLQGMMGAFAAAPDQGSGVQSLSDNESSAATVTDESALSQKCVQCDIHQHTAKNCCSAGAGHCSTSAFVQPTKVFQPLNRSIIPAPLGEHLAQISRIPPPVFRPPRA